jgi:hypothetical protein
MVLLVEFFVLIPSSTVGVPGCLLTFFGGIGIAKRAETGFGAALVGSWSGFLLGFGFGRSGSLTKERNGQWNITQS